MDMYIGPLLKWYRPNSHNLTLVKQWVCTYIAPPQKEEMYYGQRTQTNYLLNRMPPTSN
jgi:hypothetical protein